LKARDVRPSSILHHSSSRPGGRPLANPTPPHAVRHLEHDVDVERVAEFKRVSHAALAALADAIDNALPGLRPGGGLDVVTAANALAATLWQVAHPPEALARVYADDPTIAPTWALDFVSTLTRLLTATCVGLLTHDVNLSRHNKPESRC
jgi:hypothetical protein